MGPTSRPSAATAVVLRLFALLWIGVLILMGSQLASVASAEPLCTDTWVGGASGNWATGANWSTGNAPSSSDVACIATGHTVKVESGTNPASVVEDAGTLVISGGSLELTSALESSTVSSLTMSGGSLSGVGPVHVSSSFEWTASGSISGWARWCSLRALRRSSKAEP